MSAEPKDPPHQARSVQERIGELEQAIHDADRRLTRLRRDLQRMYELTENLREVFWLTDWDRNEVLYISPSYELIWGCSADSLYDRPESWSEAIHPEDRERVVRAFAQDAPRGRYDVEYRIVYSDGSLRWIRDRAFPLEDEQGRVIRLAGVSEDITERKRLQIELQAERERLEERCGERNARLMESNRVLEKARAEKDALVQELEAALVKLETLRGMLPMCSHCKKVRDDRGYWQEVESYLKAHTDSNLRFAICPDCARKMGIQPDPTGEDG